MPAEWVEATSAFEDQRTLVYFVSGSGGGDVLRSARPTAERLAAATGGRILMVNCGPSWPVSLETALEAGVTAYAWLLGEGCDVTRTTFVSRRADDALVRGILEAAARRGLPVPRSRIFTDAPSAGTSRPQRVEVTGSLRAPALAGLSPVHLLRLRGPGGDPAGHCVD